MRTAEKAAWALGVGVLAAALVMGPRDPSPDGGRLVMVIAAYAIGLHWTIAYYFDGTMYGALRLQPTHTAIRVVVLIIGVALVVFALQYVLGLGGPFA